MSETSTPPYGGEKMSGLGCFDGRRVLDEFTIEHRLGTARVPCLTASGREKGSYA